MNWQSIACVITPHLFHSSVLKRLFSHLLKQSKLGLVFSPSPGTKLAVVVHLLVGSVVFKLSIYVS